jgi:hypothetical protein
MNVFTITREQNGDKVDYQVHGNVSLADALQMILEVLVNAARQEGYEQGKKEGAP